MKNKTRSRNYSVNNNNNNNNDYKDGTIMIHYSVIIITLKIMYIYILVGVCFFRQHSGWIYYVRKKVLKKSVDESKMSRGSSTGGGDGN
jgi:hypothetical protein